MNMLSKLAMIALGAGGIVSPALAQTDGASIRILGQAREISPRGYPATTYGDRAFGAVFDTLTNCGNNYTFLGGAAGNKRIMEDVGFAPGPWGTSGPRLISQVVVAMGTTPAGQFDGHFVFWDRDDVNFAGFSGDATPMVNPAATPLGSFVATFEFPANTGDFIPINLSGMPGGGISIPDDSCYLEVWISAVGGSTQTASGDPGAFIFTTNTNQPGNSSSPGTTLPDYARDFNYDSILTGRPVAENVSGSERRFISIPNQNGPNPPTVNVAFGMILAGEFTVPPPPSTNLGTLADGVTTTTGSESDVYRFTIPFGALDADLKFIDLDTENSAIGAAIGLFTSGGSLVASDESNGSADNAMLSFGIGRRPAVGDGRQYDGRNYDRTSGTIVHGLPAGTYYLAVGPDGTTFGDGFTINRPSGTGSVTVNVTTNVNNGALADSVPPVEEFDTGVVSSLIPLGPIAMDPFEVHWVKFTTCRDATDAGDSYLDIDTQGTTALDMHLLVFDSSGNVVAQDTDSGPGTTWPGLFAQLSFGDSTNPRPAVGDGLPFAGQNGDLYAGTYYLAISYLRQVNGTEINPVALAPNPASNGRWHARGYNNNGGYAFNGGMYPSWVDCPPPATCDPDYDQNGVADQDDVALLIDIVAGGSGTSPLDPDFNCTGTADQDDVAQLIDYIASGGTSGCTC